MTPEIFTAFDPEDMMHVIMVRSHGRAELFGPRIFRAPPHPEVKFRHESEAAAERDCAKIRKYLAGLDGRKVSKKTLREEGAGL